MNCVGTFKERIQNFVVYEVEEDISVGRSNIFEVTYDSFEEKLKYRRHSSIKSSFDEPSMDPRDKSYDGMLARSKIHSEVASRCSVLTSIVHRDYDKIEDIKEYKEKKQR
ncbi:hypothetical protein PIB30_010816 [Stylosanthes scabra]|uniref:Uncharacterized protein n=1 Tax=Stylosanthes scabra TaxID=79078 RepID=A0ABU6Q5G6_9FABA|nr:hypothetical protein [Stylosanthes scabra]